MFGLCRGNDGGVGKWDYDDGRGSVCRDKGDVDGGQKGGDVLTGKKRGAWVVFII